MIIGISGATGFVGTHLLKLAARRGHEVIAFTRSPEREVRGAMETRRFSLEAPPDLGGCEAVIHLAGEPILGFWTAAKRRHIVESRVQGTRLIVEAINAMTEPPEVLVSASAIGFYGDQQEREITEQTSGGSGFLAETTSAWEAEARRATNRVALLRTSVVLGREGGALRLMAPIFRLGLGGKLGSGQQWMSWMHVEDLARLALFAVEDMEIQGPLNASSPWPVRHEEFVRTLARVLHRPAIFRVPAFVLKLALRGLAAELLESKRVVPAAAIERGFAFNFPELQPALKDLL